MNQESAHAFIKRKRIINLSGQVLVEYQQMGEEIAQLDEWEWENDFDFTILGLMEVFSSHVGGYASQIAKRGTVGEPEHAVKFLENKYLFDQPYFVDWYFSPDNHYVKIKEYINQLDHLRLMLIEYITHYQTSLSTSLEPARANQRRRVTDLLSLESELTTALWEKNGTPVLSTPVKNSTRSSEPLVPSP